MAADLTINITTGALNPPVLNAVTTTTPLFPEPYGESFAVKQTELVPSGGGGSTRPSSGFLYPRGY